jgi:hypothetical protein
MTPAPARGDLAIACELSAEALASRRDSLAAGPLRESGPVEEIDDGLRWRFATRPGLLVDLASLIEAERACCRFLTFQLLADAAGGTVTLDVTGPPGTREFLQSWAAGEP